MGSFGSSIWMTLVIPFFIAVYLLTFLGMTWVDFRTYFSEGVTETSLYQILKEKQYKVHHIIEFVFFLPVWIFELVLLSLYLTVCVLPAFLLNLPISRNRNIATNESEGGE
ncbi:hypothetical protein A8L34_28075 [Bacillus sp. FJAT-27264]|uniref:hypothetical protein n=1 Tax=Paenibacillus sp. (strain DSM 101736 / FJAT-27264) TaxID=1850362 RepID=UPI000807D26B|nr:hypothetical protein [Bacillus sp. FJAT-27264]OBZ15907.1 hypothetical protein A8L34_28075 [Bacillus sp. FJAT-27264]